MTGIRRIEDNTEKIKQEIRNLLALDYRMALAKLETLSLELKYKISTVLLLSYPNGIFYPPRYFQPIDHNGIKGIGYYMDIDACISFLNENGNINRSCFLEAKTNNETNSFENWISNENTKHRRMQLEHLIDCNTITQDLVIYAIHNVPEYKCIPLHELIIKKVYTKRNDLNDEKGQWIDDCNDYSFLDLAILLSKNKMGF